MSKTHMQDCTRSLPKTRSGKITHVVHVADVHIRSGDAVRSRYDEYQVVFWRLFDAMRHLEAVKQGSAVTVLAGDVFHDKSRLESPGIHLFQSLIHGLASIAPVYCILGNHDMSQSDVTSVDMLSAFLSGDACPPNVAYMRDTGLYRACDGVGFGLLAIQDVLLPGSGSGTLPASNRPPFPDPKPLRDDGCHTTVALFHGALKDACLGLGPRTYGEHGEDHDALFRGYDVAMLGDIHAMQVSRPTMPADDNIEPAPPALPMWRASGWDEDHCCWAYSGSLIQQNHGEAVMGHGFLCWDLKRKVVDAYHVPNDYGMVTVAKDYRGCWMASPLSDALSSIPGFPRRLTIRVAPGENTDGLEEVLQKYDARLVGLRRHALHQSSSSSSNVPGLPKEDGLAECNTPSAWITYVAQNGDRDVLRRTPDWEAFFASPERLCVPMVEALSVLQDVSSRRNEGILKKIAASSSPSPACAPRCTLDLHRIDFGWMLCYGAECCFDFQMIQGRVAALAARNGSGKSAFLEIVCYALFGKGIPSRTTVANSGSAVCQMIPKGKHAYTSLRFAIQDKVYVLTRHFERTFASGEYLSRLQTRKVTLAQDGAIIRQDAAVKDWIAKNVGSMEGFLHTAMITQYNDEDFFGLSSRDQADRLSQALGLDATQAFADVLRESRIGHAAAMAAGAAVVKSLAAAVKPAIPPEELEACAVRVLELRAERRRLEEEIQALRDEVRDIDVSLLKMPLEELLALLAPARSKAVRMHLHLLKDTKDLLIRASQLVAQGAIERESDGHQEVPIHVPVPVPAPTMSERDCSEVLLAHRVWLERWPWSRLEDVGDVHALHEAANQAVVLAQTDLKEAHEQQRERLRRSNDASAALEKMYLEHPLMKPDTLVDDEEPPEAVLPEGIQDEEVVRQQIRQRDEWLASADPMLLAMNRDELVAAHTSAALEAQDAWHASLQAEEDLRQCEADLEAVVGRIGSLVEAWQRMLDGAPDVPLVSSDEVAEANLDTHDGVSDAQVEKAGQVEGGLRILRADEARLADIVKAWDASGLAYLAGCACMKHQQQVADRGALARVHEDIASSEQVLSRLLEGSRNVEELRSRLTRRRRAEFVIGQKGALEAYQRWQASCEAIKADIDVARRDRETLEAALHAHRLARSKADGRLAAAEGRLVALERFQEQDSQWRHDGGALDHARAVWDAHRLRQAWAYMRCMRSKREAEEALESSFRRTEDMGIRLRDAQDHLRDASEAARMADRFAAELEERMPVVQAATEQVEIARRHCEWMQAVRQAELDEIGARLRRHQEALAAQEEAGLLDAAMAARPAFDVLGHTTSMIQQNEAALEDALISLASLKERKREHDATRVAHERAAAALEALQARHDSIAHISGLMDGFKSWLFEHRVGPTVSDEVNRVLAFSDNADLALRHCWHASPGVLLWYVQDGPRMPPVEKAGGFQRFIVGLAMRIALARLGATNVNCNQLFIDEGFVACDADNLGRAPAFLRGLLGRYGSLLLVSHLDEIRECADVKVRIERTPDGAASLLRLGQPRAIPTAAPGKKNKKSTPL